jgi:hypothetical protein
MKKFEYKAINLSSVSRNQNEIDLLNRAGAEGWELVSVSSLNVAILKREISVEQSSDKGYAGSEIARRKK